MTPAIKQQSAAVPSATPIVIDTKTPAFGAVRAVTFQDLQDPAMMAWLMPKLQRRWPHIHPVARVGWLLGFSTDNTMNLVTCERQAVGLVHTMRDGLDAEVRAEVLFGYCAEGGQHALAEIYRHFVRWARARHAEDLRFDRDTDLTVKVLDEIMPFPEKRLSRYAIL